MAIDPIVGGAMISGGANLASQGMNVFDIGGNRMRRKQVEQQQKLTDQQVAANKELADYGMGISKEMFEYTGYGAQRRQMEEAGLNPALMYGHAGAGGSTQSAGAGSAGMGQASDEASMKMAKAQQQGMALQMAKIGSEIAINKAQAKKLDSEASNLDAKTTTEDEQRDYMIEAIRQAGLADWLDNVRKDFLNRPESDEIYMYRNAVFDFSTGLHKLSTFNEEITTAIAKGLAEAGKANAEALLLNKKAEGYWNELLNATKHADADKMKAAAIKLSAEWSTGEMTNWKTWVDLGIDAINIVGNIIGTGAKVKGANAAAKNAGKTRTTETHTSMGKGTRRSITRSYMD